MIFLSNLKAISLGKSPEGQYKGIFHCFAPYLAFTPLLEVNARLHLLTAFSV